MTTTPTDRKTMLARRLRLDIDTATFPASQYQRLRGIYELNPIIESRTQDDETYDDAGWMREATTGGQWRLEVKFKHSTGSDGETLDPVQAFLRAKFLAAITGSVTDGEFGVMVYDQDGRDSGYEFEGRAYVKAWARDNNAVADTEGISITLQGQGAPTEITNPEASALPVVSSVSPTSGDAAGGELVNIYGRKFTGATDVDFGATAANEFVVVDDSHIVVLTPAVAASTVQVKVTNAAGASADTSADNFTFA